MIRCGFEVTINDDFWPQVSIVIRGTDANGVPFTRTNKAKYDGAYSQFEGDLHNVLRPVLQSLIDKRKRS